MISGILAVLTLFTTLFADWTPVFAASPSANMSFWYASVKDHDIITGFSKTHTGSILYAVIDGHSAYCMNFGLSAKGGQLMTSDTDSATTMTAEQRYQILLHQIYVPVHRIPQRHIRTMQL